MARKSVFFLPIDFLLQYSLYQPIKVEEMLDLLKPMEPPMKRRAGLRIVQAGRGSYRGS